MAACRAREELRWAHGRSRWAAPAAAEVVLRSRRPAIVGGARGEGRRWEAGGGWRLRGLGRDEEEGVLGFTLLGWWVVIGLYSSFA
jgi:hypothetical protein